MEYPRFVGGVLAARTPATPSLVGCVISSATTEPPGGIVLRAPSASWRQGRVTVNGQPVRWRGSGALSELHVTALPARIAIEPRTQPRPTNKKTP